MFTNLYFKLRGSQFHDHNFNSFPDDRIEQVPESGIKDLLEGICDDVPDRNTDPQTFDGYVEAGFELESIFENTLTHRACTSFFRSEPHVPAIERDYYLSKLCQFLWLIAIECGDFCRKFNPSASTLDHNSLEALLDSIPDERLPQLAEFDWQAFRSGLCAQCKPGAGRGDMLKALGDLNRFLPPAPGSSGPARATHPQRDPASEAPQLLSERRQRLVERYKNLGADYTSASVYKALSIDRSDFYKWRRGKYPDRSSISQRIEEFLNRKIQQN